MDLAQSSLLYPELFANHSESASKVVTYRTLHPSESEYQNICEMITNEEIVVENIVKVDNPFLTAAYHLKKKQYQSWYGDQFQENLLFHGTHKENLDNICTNNFNWRLYGTNHGHRFGQGVSFTPKATWASHYGDDEDHKVMLVAKVLMGNCCVGSKDMVLPPNGFDTTQNDSGAVVVKYEDNEFLPAYKVYYHFDTNNYDDDWWELEEEEEEEWEEAEEEWYEEDEEEWDEEEELYEEEEEEEEEEEDYEEDYDGYDYYDDDEEEEEEYYSFYY